MRFGPTIQVLVALGIAALATPAAHSTPANFSRTIRPLFERYCETCHGEKKKGGLDLRIYREPADARRSPKVFAQMLSLLENREMPPENRPQPTAAERALLTKWIDAEVLGCDCTHPDPGRVTIRRLNRTEYNHTIRDLVGVTLQPAEDFPDDEVGYGFDNIGDVLSLSPLLLEKYLTAAEKILDAAVVTHPTNTPPPSHTRIFVRQPTPENREATAREIISRFATRAYRRPLTADEVGKLMKFFTAASAAGEPFEHAVKLTLQAVLVSPNFLFRGEWQPQTDHRQAVLPVDEFALASRLSYFLWSSMPDEELFALAGRGALRRNLDAQVHRMLRDSKSAALVGDFASQWLQIRNLETVAPDPTEFPDFDEPLRQAMARETELFVSDIIRHDRNVLELLRADYTFVNERLARHYGLPRVKGEEFRRVSLRGTRRGGLLTQASVLTVTSNPTRTSPVKRGKWVLENILGTPPPPPPANVPPLPEGRDAPANASLRERMESHRADPACASCHARMDPIGFGFENFDAIGRWREQEAGKPIDASGRLGGGESFQNATGLEKLLGTKLKDQFLRCLAAKLLTYALGRGLEHYDHCALEEITKTASARGNRFSSFVLAVARSTPFQMRRGEAASAGQE